MSGETRETPRASFSDYEEQTTEIPASPQSSFFSFEGNPSNVALVPERADGGPAVGGRDLEMSADLVLPMYHTESGLFHRATSSLSPQVSRNLLQVRPHVLTFTQRPYDYLERKIGQYRRKLVNQSLSVIFHSSSPLAILLRRPAVSLLLLSLAGLMIFFTVSTVLARMRPIERRAFRFTALELRSRSHSISHPHVASFFVLQERRGCLEEVQAITSYTEGAHVYAFFPNKTRMDGFSVVTSNHSAELDPVRFVVSGQSEEGAWDVVGSATWHLRFSGERRPNTDRAGLPLYRGEEFVVDLRMGGEWPWFVGRAVGDLAVATGLLVAGVSGLLGLVRRIGTSGLELMLALAAVAMLVSAVGFASRGQAGEAWMWVMYAGVFGPVATVLWWSERRLLHVLWLAGVALLVADVVSSTALVGAGWPDVSVAEPHVVLAACMLCGALFLSVLSAGQHHAVSHVVLQDYAAYTEVWQALLSQSDGPEQLAALQDLVDRAQTKGGAVAQCHRLVLQGGRAVGVDGSSHGSPLTQWRWWVQHAWSTIVHDMPHESVRMAPIRSLDQIYAQALCLRPILRGKAQAWAAVSGGMFPTLDGGFVRWSAVHADANQDRVRWSDLKQEDRAMEKVIRCYGEDVSRLVDVCRQTIVFETVGALAACFEAIASDQHTELIRVKNRLSEGFDGRASAGFRNVSMNLRVRDDDAKSFGVDTHVCEVQLVLLDFAKRQMDPGRHERFVLFRNYDRPTLRSSSPWANWLLDQIPASPPHSAGDDEDSRTPRRRRARLGISFRRPQAGAASRTEGSERSLVATRTGSNAISASLVYDFPRRASSSGGELVNVLSFSRLNFANRLPSSGLAPAKPEVFNSFRELIFRRNTSSKGKKGHLRDFWTAMEKVSASSVFFIKHPVQGALSKRLWRVWAAFIGVVGLVMCLSVLYHRLFIGHSFQIYRFTALAIRGEVSHISDLGTHPAEHHGIAEFGVAARSCPVRVRVDKVVEDGPTYAVHYAHEVWMDGFWYVSSNHTPSLDPLRFRAEGSNDGKDWMTVGASGWKDLRALGMRHTDDIYWTSERRNHFQLLQIGGWTKEIFVHVLLWQTPIPCLLAVLISAIRAMNRRLNSVSGLAAGTLGTFFGWFVMAFFEWDVGGWKPGLLQLLSSSFFLAVGLTIIYRQQHLFVVIIIFNVFVIAVRLFFFTIVMGSNVPVDGPLGMMVLILFMAALAGVIRLNILYRSRHVVERDKQHYDTIWARIMADNRQDLKLLEDLTRDFKGEGDARHYYHPLVVSGRSQLPFHNKTLVPIRDIDQIYAQATCLHPILRNKVQGWASESDGMFAGLDGSFVRWREAESNPHVRATIKWGQIKKEARAIEKVIRCYGEDVSRLVDVCRQTIVFETVGALAVCFEAIASDQHTELIRVKNRLSEGFDGRASAGFRNVSMNLRVRDDDAKSFGVDTHVCEVQLVLLDFAKLQKSEGHTRYVHFRNVRGE